MTTIYMQPQDYGLRLIGEVSWMEGPYEFDLTAVWQDVQLPGHSGALYVGDDNGCSCRSPFDGFGRADVTLVLGVGALESHLRRRDETLVRNDERSRVEEIRALVRKAREALK